MSSSDDEKKQIEGVSDGAPRDSTQGDSTPSDSVEDGDDALDAKRMSLLEHLSELRTRLRNAGIAFVVALIGSLIFAKDFFVLLTRPIQKAMVELCLDPNKVGFVYTSPTEPFWCYFKLAIIMSILVASPFIFWELWKFIAPGLYRKEKKLAGGVTAATALCFVGGALFGYFALTQTASYYLIAMPMPDEQMKECEQQHEAAAKARAERIKARAARKDTAGVAVAAEVTKPDPTKPDPAKPDPGTAMGEVDEDQKIRLRIDPMQSMEAVSNFQIMMLAGCGVAFELPVVLSLLGLLGLISAGGLWRFNKYALVLSAVVGGVLTPSPDVISQLLLAGPLYALYNISIVIVWFVERARRKKMEALEDAPV